MAWKFEKEGETDIIRGFNDISIEKFAEKPTKSLVREGIQNSSDVKDPSIDGPVHVVIKQDKMNKDYLDGFKNVEDHLKSCKVNAKDTGTQELIQRHIDSIEEKEYSIIEISDYRTTGMNEEQFVAMTQAEFMSVGKAAGSQGNKGVGKASYFANSYLRSVIVVTKNEEGLRYRWAAKLGNHPDPDNRNQMLMSLGLHGDRKLHENTKLPKRFRRSEKGTSIYMIGAWEDDQFEENAIREVLRNFWLAIMDERLIVTINNLTITNTNVESLIYEYFEDYKDYLTGDKQNPRPYLETYKKGKLYECQIANLGTCKLWLHMNNEYSLGAVARFRGTKMLIYKEKDIDPGFAGVFICESDEGNRFLKAIENDEHNAWKPDLNKDYKDRAVNTLKEIREFITESYAKYTGIDKENKVTISEIDALFSFSGDPKKVESRRPKPVEDEGTLGEENDIDKKITIIKNQSFIVKQVNGKYLYDIKFTSKKTVEDQLFKVTIGTDSSQDYVDVLSTSTGNLINGMIKLDIKDESEITIKDLALDIPFLVIPTLSPINFNQNEI